MSAEFAVQICLAFLSGAIAAYVAFARPARTRAEVARKRCSEAEQRIREEREARQAEAIARATAKAMLEAERKSHRLRLDEFEERIDKKFAVLATDALDSNSLRFLRLVSERFGQHQTAAEKHLQDRQDAIERLVRPIGESLSRFEGRVGEIEKARAGAYSAIREQVRNLEQGQVGLRSETSRLVQALRQPKVRGRWGECQLQNVLEVAGMTEHVDFVTQNPMQGEDGLLRPDVTVRLPGGKSAIIDAKTPLESYLEASEADDEETRQRALSNHARHVREHVRNLASKAYWKALPESPDFVVMFIPGEAFYDAAARLDPELYDYAVARRVLVSTPTTLIALLRAIAFGWQQERLAENAHAVRDQAHELYKRVRLFGEHMDKLGKALRQAVGRYNRSVGSLEARVLPSARKFENLGAAPTGLGIPELAQIDINPRPLQAGEMVAATHETEASS